MQTYKFYNKEKKEWEIITPERWQWEVFYNDGTSLKQFDDTGIFHQIKEIDNSKIKVFRMVNMINKDKFFDIYFSENMKFIHFYKKGKQWIFTDKEKTKGYPFYYQLYYFGFEKKILGKTIKVINIILPNDSIIVTDNPNFTVNFGNFEG